MAEATPVAEEPVRNRSSSQKIISMTEEDNHHVNEGFLLEETAIQCKIYFSETRAFFVFSHF